jgi:hypothetical protein
MGVKGVRTQLFKPSIEVEGSKMGRGIMRYNTIFRTFRWVWRGGLVKVVGRGGRGRGGGRGGKGVGGRRYNTIVQVFGWGWRVSEGVGAKWSHPWE